LGGFGLTVDGEAVVLSDSCQRLVAFLVLAGTPQQRSLVAQMLWPDKPEDRASANLRTSLWRMPRVGGRGLVLSRGPHLAVDDRTDVDVWRFEELGWSLLSANCSADAASLDRCGLFCCDLLPGWFDDWVLMERERLTQLRLHFMEALTYELMRTGAVAEALDTALRLVAADPLREGSQRALLTVYCVEGSLGQAQHQLDRYTELLEETFRCRPALSIGRIMAELERGQIGPRCTLSNGA
jgi:DNA-binding SARP family transcriptional activator